MSLILVDAKCFTTFFSLQGDFNFVLFVFHFLGSNLSQSLLELISLLIANKEVEESRFLDTMLCTHCIILIFWGIINTVHALGLSELELCVPHSNTLIYWLMVALFGYFFLIFKGEKE